MRLFLISRDWLEATNEVLAGACASRGIELVMVTPDRFGYRPEEFPGPGDLLYRAAADTACDRLEKLLWRPGVAAFYEEPYFECLYQGVLFQNHGIPMPRTIHAVARDRAMLERQVEHLGGFPLVAKVPGSEGGHGIIRVDSYPALFSLLDYLGDQCLLMEYFEHVVAYRLVVVGDQVVASEARHSGAGDFRSNSVGGGSLGAVRPPQAAVELALRAARLLRTEFGGADILENAAGELRLAELNVPCYFADQQRESGIDIAGAMLDYLAAKADRQVGRVSAA
jgi:hypothetical protein